MPGQQRQRLAGLLLGEDSEDLVGAPAELTPRSARSLREDPEPGELAERREGGRAGHLDPPLDRPCRENRVFEGQFRHLVRDPAGSRLHLGAVLLADIGETLGSCDRVFRLRADTIEEQREPSVEVASLPHCLERVVVVVATPLEIRRQVVEKRLGEPAPHDEEEHDQQPSEPAVAIEERVDRLELVVEQGGLDQRGQPGVLVNEAPSR